LRQNTTVDIIAKLLQNTTVDIITECILWDLTLNEKGYGQVRYKGKLRMAHKVYYELLIGPIGNGLQLDHTCEIKRCINPFHLQQVTNQRNVALYYMRKRARERESI